MPTPSWTDDHARLVAGTAPVVAAPTDAEMDRVWNLVADIVAAPDAAPRRRRRIALGAGVAALVLGTSGIAAANLWPARTGEHNTDPESIRLGGPGELIDPRGDDYEQVLVEEIADIPFPSDEARTLAVGDQVFFARRDAGSPDTRQITGGMRAEAARAAICAWANVWAGATTSGDADRRNEAIGMLEASRTWPAVTDVDAEQVFTPKTMDVVDEAGVVHVESYVDNTPFAYLSLVAKAAHGRDLAAMGRPFMDHTRCIPSLMPDLPAAVPAPEREN